MDVETSELPKINQKSVGVQTLEEAQALVRKFWITLGHGNDLIDHGDLTGEITYGDRTIVRKSTPKENGKYTIIFVGNNQLLSKQALAWLKEQHLL